MRVVSLVPSITETLLEWGITPIAVTRFCEQPDLPAVGGTKNPDLAAIVALAPDLVVVDEEENRKPDADALVAAGLDVHVTAVRSLTEVTPTLERLALRVGIDVDVRSFAPPSIDGARLRVFVPIWRRPWMTLSHDTYGSSLLAAIGADTILSDPSTRYPEVDSLAVAAAERPGLALLPTEPYAFDETHLDEVERELRCPAFVVDGRDLFWWGVRTPDAVARLAAHLTAVRP